MDKKLYYVSLLKSVRKLKHTIDELVGKKNSKIGIKTIHNIINKYILSLFNIV